jgi:hypothetical protein
MPVSLQIGSPGKRFGVPSIAVRIVEHDARLVDPLSKIKHRSVEVDRP